MSLTKYTHKKDQELEEAIKFLVSEFDRSGHNPKPVIFHSIKVAMYLYDLDYPHHVIIAAVLHDLIEDTTVTKENIAEKFGKEISQMVDDLSFNNEIGSKEEQYIEMFKRTKKAGIDPLIIKCADIYQNSFFVGNSLQPDDYFIKKIQYFLEMSEDLIGDQKPWKDLKDRLEYIKENNTKIIQETV